MIKGEIVVNDSLLQDGDGAEITGETTVTVRAHRDSEFLLFDLP